MKKSILFSFVVSVMTLSFSGLSHAQLTQIQNLSNNEPEPAPQLMQLNLNNLQSQPLDITITEPTKGKTLFVQSPFDVKGTCVKGSSVLVEAKIKNSPVQVTCTQDGTWSAESLVWNTSFQQGPVPETIYAYQIYEGTNTQSPKVSVAVNLENGGEGGGCAKYDYQVWLPPCDEGPNEGMGFGGYIPLEITDPENGDVVEKEDPLPVKGVCAPDYHVFLSANATKNPFYTKCSGSGTFNASSLKWLDSVQKGSNQSIYGYQVGENNLVDGDDQVTVKIADEATGCSDGLDNDNDGLIDENDPGCWENPGDPGSYDPNDDDEGDEPECADNVDNDGDNKTDAQDPGCWANPNDPGSYDPSDDNENDESGCSDGIDNDNDGLIDAQDPGCWENPGDPGSYDPDDDDESDEPQCADNVDNDSDGKTDENDPGCWANPNDPGSYDPSDDNENDESGCSDGIDNDNDGLIDENDPGCWVDPTDPGTYDPNDDDEGDEPSCADGLDNDSDGKIDEQDPGCHTDGDPNDGDDSYDPMDDNENDEAGCADGIDNDNDGLIDENDPGCWTDPTDPGTYDPTDDNENDEAGCADGIDNDNDGLIDENDPGCWVDPTDPGTYDPTDDNEGNEPSCGDGVDNDNDGKIDADDPGCWTDPTDPGTYDPTDDNEADEPACADGEDNDGDGFTDAADPGCHTDGDPNDGDDTYNPYDGFEQDEDDNGAIPYDPDVDYKGEANRQCLAYNPLRKLSFNDVTDLNAVGARAAIALKNTYLFIENYDVSQYLLSGYGGDLTKTGVTTVGMNETMKRAELAKLIMLSHCLPVLDEDTLTNFRSNGDPMVVYGDLPRSGDAPSTLLQDITYSIQFYSSDEEAAMRGTAEGNFEPFRAITKEEIMKPITVIQEFRTGQLSPEDNTVLSLMSDRWSAAFYAKAAYQDLVQYIPNALQQPTAMVLRRNAFDLLIQAMLQRDLYTTEDQATVDAIVNP